MKKQRKAEEDFLRSKIKEAVAPRTLFCVGEEQEEHCCLVQNESRWVVGYVERGKLSSKAEFFHSIDAANFLILWMLDYPLRKEPLLFPAIDWTGYASLPEEL